MTEYRFMEPLDVLYLRGNKLFGDPGAHGEALMPPWPSLAAGALRSRMLVDASVNPNDYAAGGKLPEALAASLGTPAKPGTFRVTLFTVARRESGDSITTFYPLPADVVIIAGEDTAPRVIALQPQILPAELQSSFPLPQIPVLRTASASKPATGYWLNTAGWSAYLRGDDLTEKHLIKTAELWDSDPRLGIALKETSRTAAEGQIYTTETIAFHEHTGFLVGIEGTDGLLPLDGLVRLGGDGRSAVLQACQPSLPEPDWAIIAKTRRFRLVLTTPGVFPDGWKPPELGFSRLLSAAVPRAEIISGWDLAQRQPKPAQRTVPTGSVYWYDDFNGDIDALKRLQSTGLWAGMVEQNRCSRWAEGFNNVAIAAWSGQ